MAVTYLLDTNILSELVRKAPNPHVTERLREASGEMAIAAVTWHELLFGMLRLPPSQKRTAIERYLWDTVREEIPILAYDAAAAVWFAEERARLTQNGRPPSYPDGQIAAVAATNELILVTRNVKDFADYSALSIENWFEKR